MKPVNAIVRARGGTPPARSAAAFARPAGARDADGVIVRGLRAIGNREMQ